MLHHLTSNRTIPLFCDSLVYIQLNNTTFLSLLAKIRAWFHNSVTLSDKRYSLNWKWKQWTCVQWWYTHEKKVRKHFYASVILSETTTTDRFNIPNFFIPNESRTFPNIQMWFNNDTTTTERLDIEYAIFTNSEFFEDIHNSWLYCFTNPLELGTRFAFASSLTHKADDAKAKHVSQVQED